jgi:transketolase
MLTASEARLKSLQDVYVLREIRDLEEEVILAATAGEVEVIVATTSTMAKNSTDTGYALSTEYFDTWNNSRDDRQKTLQMAKVIQYFSDLGYTIERQINPVTQTTFQWILAW